MTSARASVAILGASGYAGQELRRWIARHPRMEVSDAAAMSAREGQEPESPALPVDPVIAPLDLERLRGCDGVFVCTPHGAATPLVLAALDRDCRVVDLSADFRLRDPRTYAAAYGQQHPAPGLLGEAVYGLTERARERVRGARLVANPGCYPTSVLLPLLPLLDAGLVGDGTIIADSKSGTSGAGAKASPRTHFGAVHDNFLAYGVGTHRHTPEIQQEAGTERIVFVPHLLPVFRGILTTLYLPPGAGGPDPDAVRACLAEAYGDETFVKVYPWGWPELNRVQGTNQCHLAVGVAGDRVVVVSTLDNLVKGAAGQALQNMNAMLGFAEEDGLS